MKLKLPSLPFWARSPSYRRTIARRLQPTSYVVFDNLNLSEFARDFERRKPELARAIRNAMDARDADGYRRGDFTAGPCYLPPDGEVPHAPGRWRWERDPAVIGAVIGFIIIGTALVLMGGF